MRSVWPCSTRVGSWFHSSIGNLRPFVVAAITDALPTGSLFCSVASRLRLIIANSGACSEGGVSSLIESPARRRARYIDAKACYYTCGASLSPLHMQERPYRVSARERGEYACKDSENLSFAAAAGCRQGEEGEGNTLARPARPAQGFRTGHSPPAGPRSDLKKCGPT